MQAKTHFPSNDLMFYLNAWSIDRLR